MTKRFWMASMCVTATVGVLVGLVVAGNLSPTPAHSAPPRGPSELLPMARPGTGPVVPSFAEIAAQLNPTVVNIDAATRGGDLERRGRRFEVPAPGEDSFERPGDRDRDGPRRGAGTGFLIDADGLILTSHHVIDGADRVTVRLTDGRVLRAVRIGSDPDTDIALIKVESSQPLPFARLGNSDTVRVGEWVVAIGNPLAYEHTLTAGVVSFIGRKLFDTSLDRYIQTDAAINFGNSGGPLINVRGEVIGINAAISARAANIGFAVPINQAIAILPQLRTQGRVARGYIGVALRDIDPDLQRALGLPSTRGALVQDVTPGSPGARAGFRVYDVIVAVDGRPMSGNDELIQSIAARAPGTSVIVQVLREHRPISVAVTLTERPVRDRRGAVPDGDRPEPSSQHGARLGISVHEVEGERPVRSPVPAAVGVIVTRVESLSAAADAGIARGDVLLEVNRRPLRTVEDFHRATAQVRSGDVLTVYLFTPETEQRTLHTVRVD